MKVKSYEVHIGTRQSQLKEAGEEERGEEERGERRGEEERGEERGGGGRRGERGGGEGDGRGEESGPSAACQSHQRCVSQSPVPRETPS